MIQQQKSLMNFLLVLGLVTTAALAAPLPEEELLQVPVPLNRTNGDSRDASLPELSRHDSSEASLGSTVKLHGSTSSELSLGNGISPTGNKSTENKKGKALIGDDIRNLEVTKTFGTGLSDSHPVAEEAGSVEHKHDAARGDVGGGKEGSSNGNSAESSVSHSDINISTQHEDSGIKESAVIKGSADIQSDSGENQKVNRQNGFESTEKIISSSAGHKEDGSSYTDSGKPRDTLQLGGNEESSHSESTGDLNSGSIASSHITENEDQKKDTVAVSDIQGSGHKQSKALALGDGSGDGYLTGISESETVKPAESDKPHNGRQNSVNSYGSSGTSEIDRERILPKEHADSILEASTSFGSPNSGSSDSVDQNGNVHGLSTEPTDATIGINISPNSGSNDYVVQSDNGHTGQEIVNSNLGVKRVTEEKPAIGVDQTSNIDKTRGLGAESEHGLSSQNILQRGVELNHGVISAEPNRKVVPGDSTLQSPAVLTDAQSGHPLLPSALPAGGETKTGHEGAQSSDFSENSNTKSDNGGHSENVQNQHEVAANSNGKFSLKNGKLLSVHVLRESKSIPDSKSVSSGTGNNRNHLDGSLELIESKPAESDHKGFISTTVATVSKSTEECGYTTGGVDTQNQQKRQRGFAWIDNDDDVKSERANGGENGNTEEGHKTTAGKDSGANANIAEISDTTGSGVLGVNLESSVGDGSASKTTGQEKNDQVTETEQVKSEILNTGGDIGINQAEQTGHGLSHEQNENKNIEESGNVSGPSEGLGREPKQTTGLKTGLEVNLEGGIGSPTGDSSISEGKHKHSVTSGNAQGETGDLVVHSGVTNNGVAASHDSGNHKLLLL